MYGRRVGSVCPGKYSQKQLHLVEIDETRAESRQKSGFGALFGRMGHVDTGLVAPGLALVMVRRVSRRGSVHDAEGGQQGGIGCGGWCWIFPAGDIRSVRAPSRPVSFRDDDAGWLHMAL